MFSAIRKLVTNIHANYFAPIVPGQWAEQNPEAAEQETRNAYGDWS